MQNHTGKEI